jgi:hypothetical protein
VLGCGLPFADAVILVRVIVDVLSQCFPDSHHQVSDPLFLSL